MKRHVIPSLIFSFLLLAIQGCLKEVEFPEFYELTASVGDGTVYLHWHLAPIGEELKYGVEVSYYLNGERKVQRAFGTGTMTITGLNNNETYELNLVKYDKAGHRSAKHLLKATPNTPFVVVSPTSTDGYTIEDGKVRIDLRFNRPADSNELHLHLPLELYINLSSGLSYRPGFTDNVGLTDVPFSLKWLENDMVLSVLTTKVKESFCPGLPCYLYLTIRTDHLAHPDGIHDLNGMVLDADKDGKEGGAVKLIFILN